MMRKRLKRRNPLLKIIFIGILLFLVCLLLIVTFSQSSKKDAAELVDTFYRYEKSGNFGGSWDLFHPLMKEKFTQDHYIQKRSHVILQDFGVKTFSYTVGKPEHLKSWKFLKTKLTDVYKVPITQTFDGEFGHFSIQQNVFVVKEKDKWTMLWAYKK